MASIALFIAPKMPLYSVKDIQLVNFSLSRSLTLSAKLLTGIEVHNDNILGADLYSTHVDIYYPDWSGMLQHIGYLEETALINEDPLCNNHNHKNGKDDNEDEDDRGICIPIKGDPVPFFSVQSRGISTSNPGAVTVYINDVSPNTYLHIFQDLLIHAGRTEILVSGVAHVKTPLGIPLSLGIVCDNTLNLLKRPIEILGRSCIIEKISTGWTGLHELADEVKDRVMDYYDETDGDIFNRRDEKARNDGDAFFQNAEDSSLGKSENGDISDEIGDVLSLECILDWHDF